MIKDYKSYKSYMRQKRFNQAMDIILGVFTVILGLIVTAWWLILLTGGF